VGDNAMFLKESWEKVNGVLELAKRMRNELATRQHQSPTSAEFDSRVQSADLDYLSVEIPKAIDQAMEGLARITKIVRAMKEFSHPGSEQKRAVNLNKAIEATVTIARNEWKYVADMELHFDPNLPLVPCLAGEINQVLLNLIVNAAHAIAETQRAGAGNRGIIEITTLHEDDWAEIQIRDTGAGIPDNVRDKIFDPFFTTKPVGKGTGQGLTLAQTVIVKKHGGRIWFETERGRGTTFFLRLPLTPGDTHGGQPQ
jgi:signal transduction histidine kinase